MPNELRITVNGTNHSVSAAPQTPLLYVLRNELHLTGHATVAAWRSAAHARFW